MLSQKLREIIRKAEDSVIAMIAIVLVLVFGYIVLSALYTYIRPEGHLIEFLTRSGGKLTRKEFEELVQQRKYHASLIMGAAIAVFGAYLAWRRTKVHEKQVEIESKRQVAERYTKAIELLAHESLAVRQGGIYALERIMKDSPR